MPQAWTRQNNSHLTGLLINQSMHAFQADAGWCCVQLQGVTEVHDLHVWALKPGVTLLAVHLNLAPGADGSQVLQQSTGYCRRLGIEHSTIQLIKDGEECCGQNVAMLGEGCQSRCTPPTTSIQPIKRDPGTYTD